MSYSQGGLHLMFSLESVSYDDHLRSADALKTTLDGIVADLGLHAVGHVFHQFRPFGATGLYLLTESHLSAHTFYETRKIHIDVFCCDPMFDPKKAVAMCAERFMGIPTNVHILTR